MPTRIGRPDFWAAIGFGFGIYWFFKGFRVYREYRVIEDTPEMPIRSIPMGLVEVHGHTEGDPQVSSPVTATPCFFFKVDIEKWNSDSSGRGGGWRHYKTHADGKPFYLEDPSGKVLVDAHDAEFDVPACDRREVSGWTGLFRATENYPTPGMLDDSLDSGSGIDPAVESAMDPTDRQVLMYVSRVAGLSGLPRGKYRLTEYCIVPEQWYDVTGTCAENPQAQDEHDRNLIRKGENEPTFLISSRDKQGVESRLRWKALAGVFGGGALAVACLAFLLVRFGWL